MLGLKEKADDSSRIDGYEHSIKHAVSDAIAALLTYKMGRSDDSTENNP